MLQDRRDNPGPALDPPSITNPIPNEDVASIPDADVTGSETDRIEGDVTDEGVVDDDDLSDETTSNGDFSGDSC